MIASLPNIKIWGALLLLALVSGFWLSSSGRPLNTGIFTVHKLIALATFIVIGKNIYALYKVMDINALIGLSLVLITVVVFLSVFASGAFLSFERPVPQIIHSAHQIAPILAVVFTTVTVYLLASNSP